jgi:hypothetical protein
MELKINLTTTEHKDLLSYCNLNDLLISSVVKDSFTTGFNIERYGLLNSGGETIEKEVIKEVIKYVEVPVVEEKEVVRIEYVEVEKPIEVIKEVQVEKIVEVVKEVPFDRVVEKIVEVVKEIPVEKIVYIYDKKEEELVPNLNNIWDETKVNELLLKIQQLENQEPIIKEVIVEKEVIKEVIVEVPVIEEVIVEKIIEVPVEVIVEKFIELPVFQSESVEEEDYFDKLTENEYVSPGMDTHEPPRPNRLSYVKP